MSQEQQISSIYVYVGIYIYVYHVSAGSLGGQNTVLYPFHVGAETKPGSSSTGNIRTP